MLRLVYSNYFEELVATLTADIQAGRARRGDDIFTRVQIVVPNRNVAAYIKLAAARRLGVAANYSFPFLKDFIAGLIPASRRGYLRMLDIPHLQALLLSALSDPDVLGRDGMDPVREYLDGGGPDPDAVDVRRLQLAEKLATLFSDYSLSRPAMVARWRDGATLDDTSMAAVERWQRQLWLAVFGSGAGDGLLERVWEQTRTSWRLPAPLFARLTRDDDAVAELALPADVYAIGFSYMPRAYQRVFARLGELTDLHVYALNPCMEYWEDLRSGWEHRLAGRELARRDAERGQPQAELSPALDDADDTPALRLWGRPGRENIRMLNELTECDFEARFVDPCDPHEPRDPRAPAASPDAAPPVDDELARARASRMARSGSSGGPPGEPVSGARTHEPPRLTVLRALQRDILFRHPERTDDAPGPARDHDRGLARDLAESPPRAADDLRGRIRPDDASIRILGCPNPQRELEVVGNEIWALVRADPTLRFNDIAVLVSRHDQDRYQAHIAAVFGELHDIPHHVVDMPLRNESRVVEALEMLLALPFGRFTRPEVLRLLTHPSVLARYPDVDPADWIHWTERLGIVHGADHADHAGTYIERDVFNWEQGIRRLALGAFMAGERSGDDRAIEFGGAAYLPEELPTDAQASAARLALVARSLIADARWCRRAALPLARWRVFLELMVSSYLAPASEDDERNLARCRAAIESLAERDLDGRRVSYRVASALVRAELDGLRAQTGEYLAHGVTIAPTLPMRPIPYRVVFMLGLGEGRFPAAERDSPIDLRAARRRRGDVGPRERDRYLFLEALLAARDRLYLSYVSRDDQTGERLEPSSVVLELQRMLRRGYAPAAHIIGDGDGAGDAAPAPFEIEVHHPLRRYDPRYFPALFDPAGDPASGDPSPSASRTGDGPAPAGRARPSAPLVSVAPAAHRQASALALRRHLERELAARGRALPTPGELRRALSAPRFADLRARLGLDVIDAVVEAGSAGAGVSVPGPADAAGPVSVSLAAVRRFLECPLQAWAAAVLRLREDDVEDVVARADEAWATPVGPMVGMLRAVFAAHLAGDDRHVDALLDRYRDRAHRAELSGTAPTGVFSDVERERHQRLLTQWHAHLSELCGGDPGRFTVHSFGRARERAEVDALLPPIVVTAHLPDAAGDTRPVQVELSGRTDPVGAGVGSVVLVHGPKPGPRHLVRGLVDQLALAASGVAAGAPHAATIVTGGSAVSQSRLGPWSQADAAAHLGLLVGEMLGHTHEYLLPCEAVFRKRKAPDQSVAAIVEGLKAGGDGFSSRWGPVAHIGDLRAPREADAMIERRFGPLLDRLREIDAVEARHA